MRWVCLIWVETSTFGVNMLYSSVPPRALTFDAVVFSWVPCTIKTRLLTDLSLAKIYVQEGVITCSANDRESET